MAGFEWLAQIGAELPILVLASVIPVLLVMAYVWRGKDQKKKLQTLILLLGVSVLGATAGLSGGLSREAAVGDIIPAALALLGGVAVYLFGVDPSRGTIASLCAIAFALALGISYAGGSGMRAGSERFQGWHDRCAALFADPEILKSDAAFYRTSTLFGDICMAALGSGLDKSAPLPNPKGWSTELNTRLGGLVQLVPGEARQQVAAP